MFRYRVYILAACLCLGGVAAMTWAQQDTARPPGSSEPIANDPKWIDTFLPELLFRVGTKGEAPDKLLSINGMFLNQEGLVLTVLPELRNDQSVEVASELLFDKAHPPQIAVVARDPETGLTLLKTPFRCQRFFRLGPQKPFPTGTELTSLIPLLPPYSENSFQMTVEEVRAADPQSTTGGSPIQRLLLRKQIRLAFLQSGLGASTMVAKFPKSSETFSLLPSNPPGEPLPGTALALDFQVAAVALGSIPQERGGPGASEIYQAIPADSARPIIEQLLKKADLPPLPAPKPSALLDATGDNQEMPAEVVRIPVRYSNGDATAVYGVLFDKWGTIVSPVEPFIGAQKLTSRWLELNLDLEWLSEDSYSCGLTVLRLPSTSTAPHVKFEINTIPLHQGDRVYRSPPQLKGAHPAQSDGKPILVVAVDQTVSLPAIPGAMRSGLWLINQQFPTGTPLFHETGAFIGMVAPDFTEQGSYVIPADRAWIAYGKSPQAPQISDISAEWEKFQSGKQVVRTLECSSLQAAKLVRTRMAGLFPAYQFSVDPKSNMLMIVADRKADITDLTAIYFLASLTIDRFQEESAERVAAMGTTGSSAANDSDPSNPSSEPRIPTSTVPAKEPAIAEATNVTGAATEARPGQKPSKTEPPVEGAAESMELKLDRLVQSDPIVALRKSEIERLSSHIEQTEKRFAKAAAAPLLEKYRAQLEESKKEIAERTHRLQMILIKGIAEGTMPGMAIRKTSADHNKLRTRELDPISQELVQKYQTASPDVQAAIRKTLERVTAEQFRIRHEQRLNELKALESRLEKLRTSLSQREKLKDQIVQQRVADVLNLETPLKWEDDSTSATPVGSSTAATDDNSSSGAQDSGLQQSSDVGNSTEDVALSQNATQTSQSTSESPGGSNGPGRSARVPTQLANAPVRLTKGRIFHADFDGDAEISIGSSDGIKLGQFLDVHRHQSNSPAPVAYLDGDALPELPRATVFGFIGQLEVIAIQSDRCTCRAVPGTRRDFMRNDDEVTTDLSGSQKLDLLDEDLKPLQGSWIEEVPQSSVTKGLEAAGANSPRPQPKLDQNKWTIDGQLLNIDQPNGNTQARGVISLGRTKKTKFIEVRALIQSSSPAPNSPSASNDPSSSRPSRVELPPPSTFCVLYRIQGKVLEMQGIENYKSPANLPAEFGTSTTPENHPSIIRLRRVEDAATDSNQTPITGASPPVMPAEEKPVTANPAR